MGVLPPVEPIAAAVADSNEQQDELDDQLPPSPPKLVRSNPIAIVQPLAVKKRLAHAATDVIKEQRHEFEAELTQAQTDRLLKKLLYEKLCVSKPKKQSKKQKKERRSYVKVRTPPSSESESEETESDY
jgi:hypothetical protein